MTLGPFPPCLGQMLCFYLFNVFVCSVHGYKGIVVVGGHGYARCELKQGFICYFAKLWDNDDHQHGHIKNPKVEAHGHANQNISSLYVGTFFV